MKHCFGTMLGLLAGIAILASLATAAELAAKSPAALTSQRGATTVTIRDGDRSVLVYRHAEVPFKPYVAELTTPGGVQVLRDSPFDHKHHHALMFAVAVDGINFWEELPKSGKEVHRDLEGPIRGSNGYYFGEHLDWVDAQENRLAQEARKITVWRSRLDATLLSWATRLEPAAGKQQITLGGSDYFGLGMRFLVSMDKVGEMLWADPAQRPRTPAPHYQLTRSAWVAYHAPANGKPVTVAIFDHPKNPRPAVMFSMTNPFAYLSATLHLSKEPLTITKDRPLAVRYGVAAWDGTKTAAEIQHVYDRWVALESAGPAK